MISLAISLYLAMDLGDVASEAHLGENFLNVDEIHAAVVAEETCKMRRNKNKWSSKWNESETMFRERNWNPTRNQ